MVWIYLHPYLFTTIVLALILAVVALSDNRPYRYVVETQEEREERLRKEEQRLREEREEEEHRKYSDMLG